MMGRHFLGDIIKAFTALGDSPLFYKARNIFKFTKEMETVYIPRFVTEKKNGSAMSNLGVFSVMAEALAAKRKCGTDITVSLMKTLAYLQLTPGVPCINELIETVKELLFEYHFVRGNSNKLATVEIPKAKRDIFPTETRELIEQLLNYQGLLMKEHIQTKKQFEEYAFKLAQIKAQTTESQTEIRKFHSIPPNSRTNRDNYSFQCHQTRVQQCSSEIPTLFNRRKKHMDEELIVRDQLKTVSIQLAAAVKQHIEKVIEKARDHLLTAIKETVVSRELQQEIASINPAVMAHEIFLQASDVYAFPSKPQNLTFCPDSWAYILKGYENGQVCQISNPVEQNISNNSATDTDWHINTYVTSSVRYKNNTGRDLKLERGDEVKCKLVSKNKLLGFGWKRTHLRRKAWGFFPTESAERNDRNLKQLLED